VNARNTLGMLKEIMRSRRVYVGVATNALSSLGNFALSISLARVLQISELGEFAVAFALYTFCTGLVRAAACEPLLACAPQREMLNSGMQRSSFLSLAFGLLILAAGAALSMPYMMVLGASLHGLTIYDFSKTMNTASFNRKIPLVQEAAWFLVSAGAGCLVLIGAIGGVYGFLIWSVSGGMIGYVSVALQSLSMRPQWRNSQLGTGNAVAFGADYVIGSGANQVTFNLVGAIAGLAAVGSLRAGSTLLGPVSIVIGSARTLAIPYLTRGIAESAQVARSRTWVSAAVIAAVSLPLLAIIAFLPSGVGILLLGDNWSHASRVLPYLALEMAFISMTTIPFAGFRALLAGRMTVVIRSCLALLRVSVVVYAAVVGGIIAVAATMAAMSGLGAVVWWVGYFHQMRKTLGRVDAG